VKFDLNTRFDVQSMYVFKYCYMEQRPKISKSVKPTVMLECLGDQEFKTYIEKTNVEEENDKQSRSGNLSFFIVFTIIKF